MAYGTTTVVAYPDFVAENLGRFEFVEIMDPDIGERLRIDEFDPDIRCCPRVR